MNKIINNTVWMKKWNKYVDALLLIDTLLFVLLVGVGVAFSVDSIIIEVLKIVTFFFILPLITMWATKYDY